MNANADDLLTLAEAAAVSGLGPATLRTYVSGTARHRPVLAGTKRGPLWFVRRADLDAYLAGRTKRPDRAKPAPAENGAGGRRL